jgi:hypothetical protein
MLSFERAGNLAADARLFNKHSTRNLPLHHLVIYISTLDSEYDEEIEVEGVLYHLQRFFYPSSQSTAPDPASTAATLSNRLNAEPNATSLLAIKSPTSQIFSITLQKLCSKVKLQVTRYRDIVEYYTHNTVYLS